ncbi:formate dehydrogenase subunit alpha [Haloprofundus sp. MHR1]|uniref:formate dehydrogenase subunit alpha n=1 Tax=Haloprofundus sp. MHR1 TaxID=2572921 RepID=UPI0010BE9FB8|nr:formate dehydrogenase subunit alpha [Haloprofundus sp. MHR1]QCJ46032.1 twin-arginine translocation signal domain-containing protein [Haloprofundus sp. MHR1]
MSTEPVSLDLDRRSFLKASALAGAVALGGGGAGQALAQSEEGETDGTDTEGELTKTICNFCAVGCGFRAERKGNAFVGQEPWHENPINNGSLCSKGAAIYGSEHSPKRLKHPLKKVDGEWRKISWSQAYDEIASELERIREEYGPDSTMWLGSAHHSNEEAYAFRKLASLYGTNNCDHQARICHSTTVAGLANTWGYGAMTNTINDYRNFDLNIIIGQNPAEAHPIAMQHILEGQRRGGTIASVDARFTKTSAHADHFYRIRPGTDVALMMGLMYYLREQDELDREMLNGRVNGWPDIDRNLDQYDLETVADITWISEEQIRELGDLVIENKPNVQIEWAMGGTQHNNGTQNIRSYALASLASGSAARSGGGLQVMRGHANVQGATDLAVASHILPGYYSVSSAGSWQYWADVWSQSPYTSGSISFRELYDRYDLMPSDQYARQDEYVNYDKSSNPDESSAAGPSDDEIDDSFPSERSMMFQNGLTVARWFDAALPQEQRLNETPIYQPNPVKAAFFWGHSANSISEMEQMRDGMDLLDLLVVVDVFPSLASVMADRSDGVIILPAASQYEHYRSLTNSHRSVQWSDPVRNPSHNTKPDLQIMQELADRLGFGDHFDWGTGPELYSGKSTYQDVLREINLGVRTIGYQQDPERLESQREYDWAFSTEDLKATQGPHEGEFWQLPWPCWGEGHPGTPIIWTDDLDPNEGGHDFRARWGTTAPNPQEWNEMTTPSQDYPLRATFDQQGEEGLNLLRDSFNPDWWNGSGPIRGVPQYPGFTTTLPEDLENADAPNLPTRYALDPTKSVLDAARDMNERFDWAEFDLDDYRPYDFKQPDPPTGRAKARAVAWNFLDPIPVHREPIESPRPDLVERWPANGQQRNFYRLDQDNATVQEDATRKAAENGFDVIMTTGRQVEHQGGGSESRSNIFLADLQPHMYAEITPNMAEELGVDGGDLVVVSTTDRGSILVKARVTNRPNDRETFLPFHWGGVWRGKSLEERYPDGTVPFALGDSVNLITSKGYDVETQMQETKAAMVKVRPATQELVDELNMGVDLSALEFPQDRDNVGTQKDFDVRDSKTVQ